MKESRAVVYKLEVECEIKSVSRGIESLINGLRDPSVNRPSLICDLLRTFGLHDYVHKFN